MLPGLTGDLVTAPGEVQPLEDFLVLERKAANFPWASHALWFYSQMVLGGHVVHARERIATVLETYRPDLYRRALRPVFAAMPGANIKVEGRWQQPIMSAPAMAVCCLGRTDFSMDGSSTLTGLMIILPLR